MKPASSFGRRGQPTLVPSPAALSDAVPSFDAPVSEPKAASRLSAHILSMVPIMTIVLMILIIGIFKVQCLFAFDGQSGNRLSLESLISFGAASSDLVFNHGQVWRLFVAPLLHSSNEHLIGNCIALFFVGMRLEAIVGRIWVATIFFVSALAGIAGSFAYNGQALTTVGASGAITGLVGALFAVSLTARINADRQRTMLKTSAFFGVPALLPMLLAGGGHVDYAAHMAGAIGGALLGLLVTATWREDEDQPGFIAPAAIVTTIIAGLSAFGIHFVEAQYEEYRDYAARSIPLVHLTSTNSRRDADKHSAFLVSTYPQDPRGHLMRGGFLLTRARFSEAEAEIRQSARLAADAANPAYRPVSTPANAVLAVLLAAEGRQAEAQRLSRSICAEEQDEAIAELIRGVGLCKANDQNKV